MSADPGQFPGTDPAAPINEFVERGGTYYQSRFCALEARNGRWRVNVAALIAGPFWAAARGMWEAAWILLLLHAAGLMLLVGGLVSGDRTLAACALLSPLAAGAFGVMADYLYLRRFNRWRVARNVPAGFSPMRAAACVAAAAAFWPLLAYRASQEAPGARECLRMWRRISRGEEATAIERLNCLVLSDAPSARTTAGAAAELIDDGVDFLTVRFAGFFDAITVGVRSILNGLEAVFVGTPWPLTVLALYLLARYVAGPRVGLFMAGALLYIAFFDFWNAAMSTISLVGASAFLCVLFGLPLGIWCAKRRKVYRIARPVLDVMQTMPSFVYLIPAIAFFSIGKPPAILATVIFAMPPMIRLSALGIMQAPFSVREAALAFGATPAQLLLKVELPLALPSIMAGINQSIMMSLSMVVIAALIGAGGLGYDVLFSLQHVEPGRGILAGIAIALCAMMIDRMVQGARRAEPSA